MQDTTVTTAYQQTLDYLYQRLPMFSRIGAAAIKADLTNTWAICKALGNPQDKLRTVHIAGTNGKGSTSHMLAAIFQEAGYKTGLYTSPHLVDFRERIRINGQPVNEAFVTEFVTRHKHIIETVEPSFFEITVAMAFQAFAQEEVDIAIIETGLGGRLDSTNVIHPDLSIITNISLDHTDLLGKTIPEIAFEKAGIIKARTPVVIGEYNEQSYPVFSSTAASHHATQYDAWKKWQIQSDSQSANGSHSYTALQIGSADCFEIQTDLAGSYQQNNIATVLTAIEVLQDLGWQVSITQATKALKAVKETTGLRGRWDILQQQPLIVADVAHNAAGVKYVMDNWAAVNAQSKHIVVGFVRDKDVRSALSLFPKDAIYHYCAADSPRALPAAELAAIAGESGLAGAIYNSVKGAVVTAKQQLAADDALLITGSFFIVGEALVAIAE